MEERKNVYLSLHKSFVREGIEYTDRATGEARTFNSATLPKGTVVDGMDVGGYEFSPMFVNESRIKGADFRDIPLLANREVWLRKTVMGPDGQPELDEGGRAVKDVSVNLIFTSFTNQTRRSRKGGFTACANVFSPIPVTP